MLSIVNDSNNDLKYLNYAVWERYERLFTFHTCLQFSFQSFCSWEKDTRQGFNKGDTEPVE